MHFAWLEKSEMQAVSLFLFPHFLPCSLWSPMPHEIRLAQEDLDSFVWWGDRKTLPQGDSGTSGHLCQIICVGDRDHGALWYEGKCRRAPSCLKSVPCHWLEISPLLQIYSYYWLCLQLPVTCSDVHNPSRVAHYIIHYLLLHLRENDLFQLHSNKMATSAAVE